MNSLITLNYTDQPFKLFSTSHLAAVGLILAACAITALGRQKLRPLGVNAAFRYGLAAVLLALEAATQTWLAYSGEWSFRYSLPLHLCGASEILCMIMIIRKSYSIYELTYFWGLGGAVQAILTPDLGPFSFPHVYFYQFFLTHGLIIVACIFMTVVESFRPTPRSIVKTFYITNIYTALVGVFNLITGSNYLYICEKPQNPSLLDILGPWPWYLLSLELVLVAMCCLCYFPFLIVNRLNIKPKSRQISG